ncbi:hypothetical protein [Cryptosporangium minutisporangium]|uniref:Uncharacterized protein n=1 Tax=Cryptosporangium minutisporangium TaxID=113569 RepID=A0ABP6TDH3_9ACTN
MTWRTRYNQVRMDTDARPARLWGRRKAPDQVFARQAVGVCELYSKLLREATPVPAHTGWISIQAFSPGTASGPEADFEVEAVAPRERGESIVAVLDPAILERPLVDRPEAYLRWLQPLLLRLADARGVPAAGFDETFSACLEAGCLLRWQGPTRSSPDRRHRATPHYRFDSHGDAWVEVQVHDRNGELVARNDPWNAEISLRLWRQSAATLRWLTPTTIGMQPVLPAITRGWGIPRKRIMEIS